MKLIFIISLIISLLITTTEVMSETMTLKQTVEKNYTGSGHVSPDGKYIAHSYIVPRKTYVAEDGRAYVELHVSSIDGVVRKFITGEVNVNSIKWSHDSQYIYYIAKRNDDKFMSIYRIAIDGGESQRIVNVKTNITTYSLNKNTSKLIYLAQPIVADSVENLEKKGFKANVYEESVKRSDAYLFDLMDLTKKHEKLAIDEHILSVEFNPKDDSLLMRVTPTALIDDSYTSSEYRLYNLTGSVLQAFKTEGKLATAHWSKNGNKVAIIGAENKNDPAAGRLFIGDVKSGKISKPLKNYLGHVRDIAWISDYQVAMLGHVGTKSEVSIVNLDNQSVTTRIAPGNVVYTSIDVDDSGKTLIGFGSSDTHPRELFDLSTTKAKKLTDSNDWLKDIDKPTQQTISYLARDGIELQGVLIYPQDYDKKKRYPLIMMVHGGPESHVSDGWLDTYSYPIKHASGKGFAIFLPNYRGSTGRGIDFSKMGQADYAGSEFNDLVDAITHLSEMGLVDKKRVGITGGSYGGYASAWAATALSEHFAASVMFVGISNQISKFGTTDIPQEMYNVHARNYPWDKWQWMLERSPIYHTDKAKTPLLIMHGDSDTRVHPSQSMELYRYIKTRTDTAVRLVFYPGEGHGNRKTAAQLDYSMRLMRWMEFYLKGKNKGKAMPPYEIDHQASLKSITDSEEK